MNAYFQPFPKIPRWSRDIVVTEKIDGTNACVALLGDADMAANPLRPDVTLATVNGWHICAQSRTSFITPESDNYGFATWVRAHAEELAALGPGRHFGEWWGKGINRNYGQTDRHFSLFNVSRWDAATYAAIEKTKFRKPGEAASPHCPPPACCRVVPVMWAGNMCEEAIYNCLYRLTLGGSLAAPGWSRPEGIVIYHTAGGYLFKKTIDGDERPKGS